MDNIGVNHPRTMRATSIGDIVISCFRLTRHFGTVAWQDGVRSPRVAQLLLRREAGVYVNAYARADRRDSQK